MSRTRMSAPVLLVGSLPGQDARQAMHDAAQALGGLLACLPDGETGRRKAWINFLAAGVFDHNPALETVNRPLPIDRSFAEEWRADGDDWIPRGYTDHWQFHVRAGHTPRFETLGYAAAAATSYELFQELRTRGSVRADTRFMVALPLAESACRAFVRDAIDFAALHAAYGDALAREIALLVRAIPPDDLVIQWDIAFETIAIACHDTLPGVFPWQPPGAALDRYRADIAHAARLVPDAVMMGLHLCYGDLGHRHVIEPTDLAVVVDMANLAARAVTRPIDYYHMPVPRERDDDAYFAPLERLDIGDSRLFLGLVHHTDGVAGSRRRMASAARHYPHFGIATECGFGRRAPDTIAALYAIHRELAADLSA